MKKALSVREITYIASGTALIAAGSWISVPSLLPSMAPFTMFGLAVATSIDAFAVGTSLALLDAPLMPAVAIIGCTTFLISAGGIFLGGTFGAKYKKGSGIAGGIILIAIGLRILITAL